jgi:hypothetical protein
MVFLFAVYDFIKKLMPAGTQLISAGQPGNKNCSFDDKKECI